MDSAPLHRKRGSDSSSRDVSEPNLTVIRGGSLRPRRLRRFLVRLGPLFVKIGQFLALPNDFFVRPHVIDLRALLFFGCEQAIDAIERDASVIADDAAAAVGIGQTRDDA